jgi:hypothetical protein
MVCVTDNQLDQRRQTFFFFFGKGPHPVLWTGPRTARVKITIHGIRNVLNYCVISIVYAKYTNVAAGRIIQPGGPRYGYP